MTNGTEVQTFTRGSVVTMPTFSFLVGLIFLFLFLLQSRDSIGFPFRFVFFRTWMRAMRAKQALPNGADIQRVLQSFGASCEESE